MEPPSIDVWDFAALDGRMVTTESTGAAAPSS
jgi:hypothetical protein